MAEGQSVRVAVRVRPFNQREKDMNSKVIIDMLENQTWITNPDTDEKSKPFAFDFSYWSHDGFISDENGVSIPDGPNSRYAGQRKVFEDVGVDVLNNAWKGFNCSLFAYGQTGSGKSYSMVGYGANKGIIPISCDEMFSRIQANDDPNKTYQVMVAMLEIYNEQVRDLLNPKINPPGGLKLRQSGAGVFVDGLVPVPVVDYKDIEHKMETGTNNRTVASTKMNATSSRAHTVFTIMFAQIINGPDGKKEQVSKINLIDLAGSERAESTGATGDRLKEGCAINLSLTCLGNVISALADQAMGKKGVFVPYRNSVLTRLLQDALGGNSKTIMICALSPASVNYEETLSTLKYAERAKKIKNKAIVNENPTDRMIRELKEENEKLKKALMSATGGAPLDLSALGGGESKEEDGTAGLSAEEKTAYEQRIADNERMLQEFQKTWEQKVEEEVRRRMENSTSNEGDDIILSAKSQAASQLPHLLNLNEDPMLSECIVYLFKPGQTRIGRRDAETKQDVVLSGLNINKEHAIVTNENNTVTLAPVGTSKVFVNGHLVRDSTELHTGFRVIIGNNFVFRFHNPSEPEVEKTQLMDWQQTMDELNTNMGVRIHSQIETQNATLEREEAEKRAELERKLEELQRQVDAERQKAQQLEQQQKMFEEKLAQGEMSPEELERWKKNQEVAEKKQQNLEAELAKQKELTQSIMAEQMKRRRQTKQIEEQLSALMPGINEANSMAQELGKEVRFEAKLTVKQPKSFSVNNLEDSKSKAIEIVVRITNTVNSNVWNWGPDKFENRLYMMRDIYRNFIDYGPQEIASHEDPFWDPPEAFEIGRSYVYLQALTQFVEISNDFQVVNYKGEPQGHLKVSIYPLALDGSDLEYVMDSSETLGKQIMLQVTVNEAKGLPEKHAHNVFVTYSLFDKDYEVEPYMGFSTSPKFNPSTSRQNIKIDQISEAILKFFSDEAIVFQVHGYTASAAAVMPTMSVPTTPGRALPAPSSSSSSYGHAPAATPYMAAASASMASPSYNAPGASMAGLCTECSEKAANLQCIECNVLFCGDCFALLHKAAAKRAHRTVSLSTPTPAGGPACQECDEKSAVVQCQQCQQIFCGDCNELLHKAAKKATHVRVPLAGGSSSSGTKCVECEEKSAVVSCSDCGQVFCGDCNELLHRAAKKATHHRVPL